MPPDRLHQQFDDAFFLEAEAVTDDRVAALDRSRKPMILVTLDASFGSPERTHTMDVIARHLDALVESLQGTLVFAPHVEGAEVPDALADAAAARALRARLQSPLIVLDAWQPREMRWLVGEAALVVSTRYHPLVFATASGTAALGIYTDAYTRTKLRGALTPAGLQGWCISVADVERHALLPLAMELWYHRRAIEQRLSSVFSDAAAAGASPLGGDLPGAASGAEALPVAPCPQPPAVSRAVNPREERRRRRAGSSRE